MSVLKLKCVDQVLTILTTPVIASGVKEVDEIEVEFNEAWTDFGKTAVFYRDDSKVYHVVMANNKCVIPHEVLATDGVLYFGLFGVHGNQRITSNVLRYKIVKGAILEGQTPKPPTPEIYEQILSVYNQVLAKYNDIFTNIDKIVADAVLQGVVNQNKPNELCKFWFGTKVEYDTLINKDVNTIYYVVESNDIMIENIKKMPTRIYECTNWNDEKTYKKHISVHEYMNNPDHKGYFKVTFKFKDKYLVGELFANSDAETALSYANATFTLCYHDYDYETIMILSSNVADYKGICAIDYYEVI